MNKQQTLDKLLMIELADRNCRIEMFGKAAYDHGQMTFSEGIRFFGRINRFTKKQRHPLSEFDFKIWPSLN